MLDVIKRSNELSLLIYTQSHDFTFDLGVETDRYARLIEA